MRDKRGDGKLRKRSEVTGASITNRIQKMEKRISGIEDTIEDISQNTQRKYKKQNAPNSKYSRNAGHNENPKPKNSRCRRERIFLTQRASKHLQ